MKKIMFFDIDGTLLDFNTGKISNKTINSLKKLQKNGIIIGIATGRQDITNLQLFENIIDFDFFISSNGRLVKIKDQTIYQEPIKKEVLVDLITYNELYNVSLIFQSESKIATYKEVGQICFDYLDNLNIKRPLIINDFHITQNIYQTMIFCDEKTELIFQNKFPNLSFIRHNGNGIDISTSGPLKEKGVQVVLDYFKVKREDALAFGDGLNDVGMFEYIDGASLGVSHQELIAISKYRLKNIEEEGLSIFLEEKNYI